MNILYHNNGDGTFTDSRKRPESSSPGRGTRSRPSPATSTTTAGRILYVAVDSHGSLLFRNRRDGTFEEIGLEAGVALSDDGR